MADNKRKPSSSLFTRIAVGAPIIGGIGVGAASLFKSMNASQLQLRSSRGSDFLRGFAAKISGNGAAIFSGDLSIMNGKSPEMIQMAWDMALAQADPAKIIRRSPLDSINPANTINTFAQTNQSLQGNKVLQSFVRQMGGLELHQAAYGGQFTAAMFGRAKKHNFIRSNVAISSIEDNILRNTLANIETHVKQIPGVEMNLKSTSREGLDGSQLMLHLSGGKFGRGVAVEIPMEIAGQPGVIAHGVTQQTKRIVGQYDVIKNNRIISTLKHEDYVVRRFYEQILPKLNDERYSSSAIRKMIGEFNYENVEGSQWIANLPLGQIPAHDAATQLGGTRRVLIDGSYSRLNAQEVAQVLAIEANGRFPSTSGAQIAKGVVSSLNAQKFWFGGEAFPWARRPLQALGRGYGPSTKAIKARLESKLRKQYDWLYTDTYRDIFKQDTPMDILAKTVYISEKKHPKFAEEALGGTLGGTGLYNATINSQFEHVEALSKNITVNADINKKLLEHIEERPRFTFDKPIRFEEGEILGYDKNRNPIHWTPDMKITGGFSYTDRDVQFIHLEGTKTLASEMHPKVFGSAKAVLQQTQPAVFEKTIQDKTGIRITGAEIALGMDELKKNRALHNNQMLTALHDFTYRNMRVRNGSALNLEAFNSTFSKSAQEILARASSGSVYNHDEVIKGIHKMAREINLGEHAIGRIFGALPDAYEFDKDKFKDWREAIAIHGVTFSDREHAAISQGIAEGVGTYFYGGPANAGGMGSVEPRFFELLQGKQFGSLGPRMSHDIAQRMILANPDIVNEQSILTRALHSIVSPTKISKDDKVYSLSNLSHADTNDLLESGGIVKTDGIIDGVKHMIIPGTNDSIAMREYVTAEGLSTQSELHYAYREFLESGNKALSGKATRATAKEAFNNLIAELGSAREGTITGKHTGLARGKVMGSRYLKAISSTEEEMGDAFTVGISKKHGLGMFDEMEKVFAHDTNELKKIAEQKQQFLSGDVVGAIVRRDPEIGPYSAMPMNFRMMKRLKDTDSILIPQKTHTLSDINGNEISKISFGAMPGFAGDFDGDNVHIMLASSKIEKDIRGHYSVNNGSFNKSYEDYIIRQQLIKAKAPKVTDITTVEEMIADAQKLAIAKTHVGPLSVPMRELRASLSQHHTKFDNGSYFDALSILEALEQTPIAGKHVPANRIDEFTTQMTRLAAAGKAGRGNEMASILQETLQHNPAANNLFRENQKVFVDGMQHDIRGLDLSKVANTFKQAYSHYRTASGDISEGISRAIANGSMKLTQQNISAQLGNTGGLLADFKLGVESGPGAEIARTALAVKNKIAAVTGDVVQHMSKPLAIGFGAALGIAAILSKPISTIEPSRPQPNPRVNSVNTRSLPPENIHPDSEITGEPSIPNTMSRPTARYRSNDQSARVNIRGINAAGANLSSVSSLISQRLQGNTNINVNMRDRKASLTQQKIDSIMRR